jgi:hypothetical protein
MTVNYSITINSRTSQVGRFRWGAWSMLFFFFNNPLKVLTRLALLVFVLSPLSHQSGEIKIFFHLISQLRFEYFWRSKKKNKVQEYNKNATHTQQWSDVSKAMCMQKTKKRTPHMHINSCCLGHIDGCIGLAHKAIHFHHVMLSYPSPVPRVPRRRATLRSAVPHVFRYFSAHGRAEMLTASASRCANVPCICR